MISSTILYIFLIAILFIASYKDILNEQEAFTVRSVYNRSMRYMRYNAHPRITRVASAIINRVKYFIPGL